MVPLSALTLGLSVLLQAPLPTPSTTKEALQPCNLLVGSWKGTGYPEGSREERLKGFWNESISIGWQFKGDDACVVMKFDKGKYFSTAELRYDLAKKHHTWNATTADKKEVVFTGLLSRGAQNETILTFERSEAGEDQRIVFTLLHHNRFLYTYSVKPSEGKNYVRQYQVGATKEGEPFADVPKGPECIVSGGLGTMTVVHNGKTYYVCCSGCRDAFKEEPEKYIAEYQKKLKK